MDTFFNILFLGAGILAVLYTFVLFARWRRRVVRKAVKAIFENAGVEETESES